MIMRHQRFLPLQSVLQILIAFQFLPINIQNLTPKNVFLQASFEHSLARQIQNYERIWDDTSTLHRQPLHSSFREPLNDVILLLFLQLIDFLLHNLNHHLILHISERLQRMFNFLS